ncbi:DUF6470 family protein [Desulfosporosinus sp. PR]|uniref:DUF6470 family protein n=1 Tax=Candidatus Desulfosporosinus nitrosoreducens TaxID=3401928 RepID=UPI0027F3AC0C|nr:DUF6470 family protein [Desulfosporosinus sp. PR]MDQ7096261.1 DUF6470 family protein [Desulfosporosinus sp. PR]
MLQLNISTQPTLLEYNIRNAQLNLHTVKPFLQMENTPATLEMRQPHGELTIDSEPCRYSIGIKNNSEFARDNAEYGRETVQKTIARIMEEGDKLAAIQNKSNAFADIAAAHSAHTELPRVTLAYIALPNITYQAQPVQFNPIDGKINYNLEPGQVQGDYQPGSVDIRVTQYPSVEISTVDVKV